MTQETIFQHKKRGTLYKVLNYPSLQINGELDNEPMVCYQDVQTGAVYVRPRKEFFDGRFVISRRPIPAMLSKVPEASIENALVEFIFHHTEGERTLDEYDEPTQQEFREATEEILLAALKGGLFFHNQP